MRKIVNLKICGIVYLMLDTVIQLWWSTGLVHDKWIFDYSLINFFFFWCVAVGIFCESKILAGIALFVILAFFALPIFALIAFIRRKDNFVIPLILSLLNIIMHIYVYWKDPASYVGLLYKVIGCTIFMCIVYKDHMNRKAQRLHPSPPSEE